MSDQHDSSDRYESKFLFSSAKHGDEDYAAEISKPVFDFEQWLLRSGYIDADQDGQIFDGEYLGAEEASDLADQFLAEHPQYDPASDIMDHAMQMPLISNLGHQLEEDRWFEHEPKVREFEDYLRRHPYLGMSHDTGKTIFDILSRMGKVKVREKGWFRAVAARSDKLVSTAQMYPAEYAKYDGRFHHYGHKSVLYLADTKENAAFEVLGGKGKSGIVWTQQFIVNTESILDLSGWAEDSNWEHSLLAAALFRYWVIRPTLRERLWKPEYLVPRFVADCARYHDFKGIKVAKREGYEILVLFDWNKEDDASVKGLASPPQIDSCSF